MQYRGTTKPLAFSRERGEGWLHLEVAALPRHRSYCCAAAKSHGVPRRRAAAMLAHIRGCRYRVKRQPPHLSSNFGSTATWRGY